MNTLQTSPNMRESTESGSSMRAYSLSGFGLANLVQVERPVPIPGPGEILIRWHAWSVNYRDLVVVEGSYMPNLPLPFTPLSDAAGEIVAVGPGVSPWQPHDRVVSHYVQSWLSGPATDARIGGTLGGPLPGLLSEYSVLPAQGILRIPDTLSYEESATLPIAALTAWNALYSRNDLHPGDTVVLEGTGGVSLFGLQLAQRAGLRTIITSSSDEKLQRARNLGADKTINYRKQPEWSAEVRRLTRGVGADLVLDVGGANTLPEALKAVRTAGRVSMIGFLSGSHIDLNVVALLRSLATLHGVRVGSRDMFSDLIAFLELHRDLKPVIDTIFPFDEATEALSYLRQGAHFGKIVIRA